MIYDKSVRLERGAITMVQAHHGHIMEDGRFVPDSLIKLPINKRVIIIWEEESDIDTSMQEMLSAEQITVTQTFLAMVEDIKDEGFSVDDEESFSRMESGKYSLKLEERL